jgi:MtN3 and saliva related transmembrane protein
MDLATWVGGAATVASTVSFAPQAWKVVRTRRTEGISVRTYSVTVTAFACWLCYGILLGKWPIIASNVVCLAFSIFILVMAVLPQGRREAVADAIAPGTRADEVNRARRRRGPETRPPAARPARTAWRR